MILGAFCVLRGYPFDKLLLYCPKCKHETLIEVKDLQSTVIREADIAFIYEIVLGGKICFMFLDKQL